MSGIFCFTTEVAAAKSIGEICGLLARGRAAAIMQEFDGAGNVTAIGFRARTAFGEMMFRLPADVLAVQQVLKDQWKARKIERRYAIDSMHARRVAWRILRHWVESQLALIEIGLVKIEQVFLPYAQNAQGQTLYEVMVEQRFGSLALPAPQTTGAAS